MIEDVASKFAGRSALRVTGTGELRAAEAGADCGESGSTLRFFIPLGALLNEPFNFTGHGKLVSRPLNAYYDIFEKQGLKIELTTGGNYGYTFRVMPKHEMLLDAENLNLVKWITK